MNSRKSKYLGQIYEGRWVVISAKYKEATNHTYYTLANMYNDMEVTISDTVFAHIREGNTTISRVLHHRIKKDKTRRPFSPPC